MLEDDDVLRRRPACAVSNSARSHASILAASVGNLLRALLQVRIEHDARDVARAEAVIVGAEALAIDGQRFRRRLVAHVVIARHAVELDLRVELGGDALVFGGLAASPALLIRSPVITTKAGFSRLAAAMANSKFAVSCTKSASLVNMPNCGSDIWMKVCAARLPARAKARKQAS